MKKKSISFILCIIIALLTGCKEKNSKDILDDMEFNTENTSSSEEYMEYLKTLPINEEDINNYIDGEIVSSEVYFDEDTSQYVNSIKWKYSYTESNFYAVQTYAIFDLVLNDEENEWELSEYNREHHSGADLNLVDEKVVDNVSGEYEVHYVNKVINNSRYKIMAKIDQWDCGDDVYGYFKMEFMGVWQGMDINIEGNVGKYQIEKRSVFVSSYDNTAELNWVVEENGFRYTNTDKTRDSIEIVFKEDTGEIFILLIDNEDKDLIFYKLVKM